MIFINFNDSDSIEEYKDELRELKKDMLEFMLKDKKESLSYLEAKIEVIQEIINEK